MIDTIAQPTLIKDILPRVFSGLIQRYEQAHDPDLRSNLARDPWAGRDIIRELRAQIHEKAIGRRGKSFGNSRQFQATLGK